MISSAEGLRSPDATASSLLASSGHLQLSQCSHCTITVTYGERRFESASEALDAYISDFQKGIRTPQIHLQSSNCTPGRAKTSYRNKDVLTEKLSDVELGYLNLPVGGRLKDEDLLSVTTDDLLCLPPDGSLPVTHTSTFLSRTGPCCRSRKAARQWPLEASQRHGGRGLTPSPAHHYPRWLTSNKSLLDMSDVSSVPTQSYPTWLRGPVLERPSRGRVPAWVEQLEEPGKTGALWEPRAALAEEEQGRDVEGHLIAEDRLDRLILNAERALSCPTPDHHRQDDLDSERSWDNPTTTFKALVPVGGAEGQTNVEPPEAECALADTAQAPPSCSSGYSSRRHPGPVEALKHMLFSLQAVEQRVTCEGQTGTATGTHTRPDPSPENSEATPGGESLKRALHHLARLKCLVDDLNDRREKTLQDGRHVKTTSEKFT